MGPSTPKASTAGKQGATGGLVSIPKASTADKEGATGGLIDGPSTFKVAAASVAPSVIEVRAGGVYESQ